MISNLGIAGLCIIAAGVLAACIGINANNILGDGNGTRCGEIFVLVAGLVLCGILSLIGGTLLIVDLST